MKRNLLYLKKQTKYLLLQKIQLRPDQDKKEVFDLKLKRYYKKNSEANLTKIKSSYQNINIKSM